MDSATMTATDRLRIGVSACLLGEPVRHDGGHKRNPLLVDILGPFVEWVPVCPEVEIGLGTPREAIRLVRRSADDEHLRLETVETQTDLTRRMQRYARRRVSALARSGLDGYILKKDSPSCGMARVRVWGHAGRPARNGRGVFAEALMATLPNLPVEEEDRLQDPRVREHFIDRLFTYRRLRRLLARRWTVGGLVAFHTAHELTLMAHSPSACRELGRLVAMGASLERQTLAGEYERGFMAAIAKAASRGRHANVLSHMAKRFTNRLEGAERQELASRIDEYRRGLLPRRAPLTLIQHHARRLDVVSLRGQVYLHPEPRELRLVEIV